MFLKYNALLRFYFHIDPDNLTNDEYAERISELIYALDFDGKFRSTHGEIKLGL